MNQYYHQRSDLEATVSVEVPDKIKLTNLIHPDKDKLLMLYVGFSICSPEDNFEKSAGRKVADARLKATTFMPLSLEYDDLYNVTLKLVPISPEQNRIKELTFKLFSSNMKVYLIGAKVE